MYEGRHRSEGPRVKCTCMNLTEDLQVYGSGEILWPDPRLHQAPCDYLSDFLSRAHAGEASHMCEQVAAGRQEAHEAVASVQRAVLLGSFEHVEGELVA